MPYKKSQLSLIEIVPAAQECQPHADPKLNLNQSLLWEPEVGVPEPRDVFQSLELSPQSTYPAGATGLKGMPASCLPRGSWYNRGPGSHRPKPGPRTSPSPWRLEGHGLNTTPTSFELSQGLCGRFPHLRLAEVFSFNLFVNSPPAV